MFLVRSKGICYNNFLGNFRSMFMRCVCCDTELTDYEATRKYEVGIFLDTCNDCCHEFDDEIPTINRMDLLSAGDEE